MNITTNKMVLPVFGIDRHRLLIDGEGITTIVGSYGCPLQCKYCLNPHAWNSKTLEKILYVTPKELYDKVKVDNLYFVATGGGIVFGGGEPLLHADFFGEFRKCCGSDWQLTVETSLNVESELLAKTYDTIDNYIIDIKDINSKIYKAYTGKSNSQVLRNLDDLLKNKSTDNIQVRVPRIPGYNIEEDIQESVSYLEGLGITKIEVFSYVIDRENMQKR